MDEVESLNNAKRNVVKVYPQTEAMVMTNNERKKLQATLSKINENSVLS